AEQGEALVGFGNCGPQRTSSLPYPGEFYSLYVALGAQRHGAGRALMHALARFLVSRGITGASAWLLRDNAGARRFYEAIGGNVIAERNVEPAQAVIAEIAYGWDDLRRLSDETS